MSLLVEEAKKLYGGWDWEGIAEELNRFERGAFLALVGSYQDLIKEIERLQCYEIDFHKAVEENIQLTRDYETTIIGLKNRVDAAEEAAEIVSAKADARVIRAEQERDELLEGLKWYADDEVYEVRGSQGFRDDIYVFQDKGERARSIIAKIEGK